MRKETCCLVLFYLCSHRLSCWGLDYSYSYHLEESSSTNETNAFFIDSFQVMEKEGISLIIDYNVQMKMNEKLKIDPGRILWYLFICSSETILEMDIFDQENSRDYCKSTTYASGELCTSIPLVGQLHDDQMSYQASNQKIYQFINDNLNTRYFFFISNCEVSGGKKNMMRSCNVDETISSFYFPCLNCTNNQKISNTWCKDLEWIETIPGDISVDIKYSICNEYQNCLSADMRSVLLVYLFFLAFWCCGLALWFYNTCYSLSDTNPIHKVFTIIPIIKIILLLFYVMYLQQLQNSVPYESIHVLKYLVLSFDAFYTFIGSSIIILISKGWRITRHSLSFNEYLTTLSITILLASTDAINSPVNKRPNQMVDLCYAMIFFITAYLIYSNCGFNMKILNYQKHMIHNIGIDPETTPIATKYKFFRNLLYFYLAFVFIGGALYFVMGVTDFENIVSIFGRICLLESLAYIFYTGIGFTFRAQRFNHLFYVTYALGISNYAIAFNDDRTLRNSFLSPSTRLQSWNESMQLPTVPAYLPNIEHKVNKISIIVSSTGSKQIDEESLDVSFTETTCMDKDKKKASVYMDKEYDTDSLDEV